jgi:deoxyhypusine synthase
MCIVVDYLFPPQRTHTHSLEKFLLPVLDTLLSEQNEVGTVWSPSTIIARLGKEIDHKDSVYYWAQKNDIPVFCPAITDGSIGDMMYFHSINTPGLVVDILSDLRLLNTLAMDAPKTGMVILGGGLVKHHTCNANLMRNGADFSVFINTGQEFDGSDSGAKPDEAISWGKIKMNAKPVKVYADASLVFPILVAQTFAKLPRTQTRE